MILLDCIITFIKAAAGGVLMTVAVIFIGFLWGICSLVARRMG